MNLYEFRSGGKVYRYTSHKSDLYVNKGLLPPTVDVPPMEISTGLGDSPPVTQTPSRSIYYDFLSKATGNIRVRYTTFRRQLIRELFSYSDRFTRSWSNNDFSRSIREDRLVTFRAAVRITAASMTGYLGAGPNPTLGVFFLIKKSGAVSLQYNELATRLVPLTSDFFSQTFPVTYVFEGKWSIPEAFPPLTRDSIFRCQLAVVDERALISARFSSYIDVTLAAAQASDFGSS